MSSTRLGPGPCNLGLENLESKCPFRQKVQVAQLLHSAGNLEQLNVHLLRAYHQDLSSKSKLGFFDTPYQRANS